MLKNNFMEKNNISVVEISEETAVLKSEIIDDFLNPYGYVHGGLLFTLADCAAGILARTDGRKYVTQTANANFVANVKDGTIVARANFISRKKHVSVVHVAIHWQDMLLADFTFNMYCVSAI